MNAPKDPNQQERRKYIRIKKSFILKFHLKRAPEQEFEITQLKNISKGGMCFITAKAYPKAEMVVLNLRTPYLVDETILEGAILESHEKIKDIIYETRVKFESISPQAEFLIEKLEEFFKKGDLNHNE